MLRLTLKYNDARRRSPQAGKLRKLPGSTEKNSQRTRGRRPAARTIAGAIREGHGSERILPQAARRSGNAHRVADQKRRQDSARAIPPRERMSFRDYLNE